MLQRCRRGFTLIELLVVIAILAVLAGILFPAIGFAKRRQKIQATRQLLGNVTLALDHYLAEYAILGDARDEKSTDFSERPMLFLATRAAKRAKGAYLEAEPRMLARVDGQPADRFNGELLLDPFRNPLRFTITNKRIRSDGAYDYSDAIEVISTAGTEEDQSDDIWVKYHHERGGWSHARN